MADRRLPEHADQRLTRSVPRRSNNGSRRSTDPHSLLEREAALRTVLFGPPQVVVSGGLGCGRSALLRAALARSSARVVSATAVPSERTVPFGIANQLAPRLSPTQPTLVAVDDVQHSDPESVAFLVWLRRFPDVRVVVTHSATDSPHRAELSTWEQVWLRPLSPDATPELHALSGGNPALLAALRDDGGEIGPATRRAFLDLLRGGGSALFEAACGLAALGPHTSLLSALTGRHQAAATALTSTLADSGLFDGRQFRLPGAAEILLGALPRVHAVALHERAAMLLHDAGAPDTDIAAHCVAAQTVVGGTDLLRRAARSATSELAAESLRLALRTCDPADARAVRLELGQVQWRTDPAAAARTLLPCSGLDPVVLRARWWQGDFSLGLPDLRPAELSLCHEFITGRALSPVDPEGVLQRQHADSAPEAVVQALRQIGPARFEHWLTALTRQAGEPTMRALLDCVRAEDAWRRGDVAATAASAKAALAGLSADAWGVVIGFPLRFALLADAALGRETEPHHVPDAVFRTVFGPRYRHARGHHHLALNRPHAALDDFTACGDRLGAAEARLALGQPWPAKALLEQEIAATADPRTTGIALRLLARTAARADRPRLLREAVRKLEHAGDRLELSRALADLGRDQRDRGVLAEARLLGRRARRESGLPGEPGAAQGVLSAAERRVAALAAAGHSNREIGLRLCVTVSTVEQHLTRVYRKLEVAGRDDLPRELLTR
ncbi:helix-turn-helix transcriptional regulator [Lentzea californiensis]|uniref:helix-turn-helix transcriptional regulator n=1 Tax=Lentzea californiensis TaxID=438851 RepID=UPI002165A81C|nr:LuxR family transcriptional regulator [Lentzea californiensis]MCR3752224.1 regulatory protein, luxR family [Lentzea californiensis]